MPVNEEELQQILWTIAWLTLIVLPCLSCTRHARTGASSPDEPDPHQPLHSRHSKLEARVDKLESKMLELQARVDELHSEMLRAFTITTDPDSPTACEYTTLLRSTIALEEQAKQLEASLPSSSDIKDSY